MLSGRDSQFGGSTFDVTGGYNYPVFLGNRHYYREIFPTGICIIVHPPNEERVGRALTTLATDHGTADATHRNWST